MEPEQVDPRVTGYQPVDNDDRDDEVENENLVEAVKINIALPCDGRAKHGDLGEY